MNNKNIIPEKYKGDLDGAFYQRLGFPDDSPLQNTYTFVPFSKGMFEKDRKHHKNYRFIKFVEGINGDFTTKAIMFSQDELNSNMRIEESDINLEVICNYMNDIIDKKNKKNDCILELPSMQ